MVNTSMGKRQRICCCLFWGLIASEEEHKRWKGKNRGAEGRSDELGLSKVGIKVQDKREEGKFV